MRGHLSIRDYSARDEYRGATAREYDAERQQSSQWQREQTIVESVLDDLPEGASILDVPFGTGRFVPLYARRGLRLVGVDVSRDMFRAASRAHAADSDMLGRFALGEAEHLPIRDRGIDFVVSTRFLSWLPPSVMRGVAGELARVARQGAIVQVDTVRSLGPFGLFGAFAEELAREPVTALRVLAGATRRALAGVPGSEHGEKQDYFYHPPEAVEEAFAAGGLEVVSRHRVRGLIVYALGEVRELRLYRLRQTA